MKNKLFMFGGFDEEIISTNSIFHTDNLTPTPTGLAQLAACFPGSTALWHFLEDWPVRHLGREPVPDVRPRSLAPTVPVAACPTGQFGGVTRILSSPTHNFNFTNRVDYQMGSDTLMARYIFNRGNNFNLDFGDAAAGYPANVPALSQAILVGWTHNLSSRMVNEARVGFNRLNVDFGGNSLGTFPRQTQSIRP